MNLIILAAGIGSRINLGIPKALIELANGETILSRQINIATRFINFKNIYVVTGYKENEIINRFPNINTISNADYKTTNTSKSLLAALNSIETDTTVWINGDVVFDVNALSLIISREYSCMATLKSKTEDEEIKFSITTDGSIDKVSKEVNSSCGEAVGINKIIKKDIKLFKDCLKKCSKGDYFERGIELAIESGLKIFPEYISNGFAMEIDYQIDLDMVNRYLLSRDV